MSIKRILLCVVILIYSDNLLLAQSRIVWADYVMKYSSKYTSEKSDKLYGAEQALGSPNVIPGNIESPCAWKPQPTDKTPFIKVGFRNSSVFFFIIV